MKSNVLVCIPSPRKILSVQNTIDTLPLDKLWIKNIDEIWAYRIMRNWFLRNTEYTHLAISPDDMLVTPKKVQRLIDGIEKYDFPVLSGWCNNVGRGKGSDKVSVTRNVPVPIIGQLSYNNYTETEMRNSFDDYIQCGFSGFAFQIIRRDIIEKIEFSGVDCGSGGIIKGLDVGFSYSCSNENIPIIVDTRSHFIHLKGILEDSQIQNLLVGREDPHLWFVKSNTSFNQGVRINHLDYAYNSNTTKS